MRPTILQAEDRKADASEVTNAVAFSRAFLALEAAKTRKRDADDQHDKARRAFEEAKLQLSIAG